MRDARPGREKRLAPAGEPGRLERDKPAPKEKPPRKLSGHGTAGASDTLESSRDVSPRLTEGVTGRIRTRIPGKLSGIPTEGARTDHTGPIAAS